MSFLAPTDGPEGLVDVTPGAVSDRKRNAILSRAAAPSTQARLEKTLDRHIDGDTHSHLYQFTVRQESIGGGFVRFVYGLDRLLGEVEPYIGYRPEGLLNRSIHNGITPRLPGLSEGSNHITVTWTVPTDSPFLVTVQPVDLREGDIGDTVPAGTNEVVMNIDATLENGLVTGTVMVNGQQVIDLSVAGSGVNFYPMLRYPGSGLFHCTMVKDGEILVDESYLQRGLVWEPVWPIIERSTFEPITFNHHLAWDAGDPSVESNQPRWKANFPGAAIPPLVNGSQPYQPSSQASFTYDPEHLSILGRALDQSLGFRLAPDGENSKEQERLIKAREAQTTQFYRVEADAVSYPASNVGSQAPVDLRIQANASGLVPAKIPQLYVDNAKFTPNPTIPGQGAIFSANIVTFFYDDPEIRWTYTLEGPDPEDPENLVVTYQTAGTQGAWVDFNQDFSLQASWDGKGPSGQPGPAGNYQGTLTVDVREKTGKFQTFHQEVQPLTVALPVATVDIVNFSAEPSFFDHTTSQVVAFQAQAEASGFDETPTFLWELSIKDANGLVVHAVSKETSTPSFEATWLPRRPDASLLGEGLLEVTLSVRAIAGSQSAEDQEHLFLDVSATSNPPPNPPDPGFKVEIYELVVDQPYILSEGEPLRILARARILSSASGDYSPPPSYGFAYTWTLTARNEAGATVFEHVLTTGSSPSMFYDATEIQEPGRYPLDVQVRASLVPLIASDPPPPVENQPFSLDGEQTTIVASNVATLTITDSRAIKVGLGLGPGATHEQELEQRDLEKSIFLFDQGITGLTNTWNIEVENVAFRTQTEPNKVEIQLQGLLSKVPTGVTAPLPNGASAVPAVLLNRVGTGHYKGTFTLTRDFIRVNKLQTTPTPGVLPQPVVTTYFLGFEKILAEQAGGLEAATNFARALMVGPDQSPYLSQRLALGQLEEILPGEETPLDRASTTSAENLAACGFEAVEARLTESVNPTVNAGLVGELRTHIRVRHPAWVVHYNFHGDHTNGGMVLAQGSYFIPSVQDSARQLRLAPAPPGQKSQLILSSCSVLDLNDYNNYYALAPVPDDQFAVEHALDAEYAARRPIKTIPSFPLSPGQAWQVATRAESGGVILLGYAATAPTQGTESVFQRYREALAEGRSVPVAWVLANLRVARDPAVTTQYKSQFMAACAWDGDDYYYIPYALPANRLEADPTTAQGVWRIPKSNWNAVRGTAWRDLVAPTDIGILEVAP